MKIFKRLVCLFKMHKYPGLPFKKIVWSYDNQDEIGRIVIFKRCNYCGHEEILMTKIFPSDIWGNLSQSAKRSLINGQFSRYEAFPSNFYSCDFEELFE